MSDTPIHIEANYKVFEKLLPALLLTHAGKFALMHDEQIVDFFDTALDAYLTGQKLFEDKLFSIQEVTDVPVYVGCFPLQRKETLQASIDELESGGGIVFDNVDDLFAYLEADEPKDTAPWP